jgi:hypothetical protein
VFAPVICTVVADVVAPAGTVTLDGDTDTLLLSVEANWIVTPPAGAALESETDRFAVWLSARVAGPVMTNEPGGTTVTVTVASGTPGALTCRTVEPAATLVSRTPVLVDVADRNTSPGNDRIPGLLDVMVKSSPPAGAGPESNRLSVAVAAVPRMLTGEGESVRL